MFKVSQKLYEFGSFPEKKLMQLKLGVLWIENLMTSDYPIRFAYIFSCFPPSNAIET